MFDQSSMLVAALRCEVDAFRAGTRRRCSPTEAAAAFLFALHWSLQGPPINRAGSWLLFGARRGCRVFACLASTQKDARHQQRLPPPSSLLCTGAVSDLRPIQHACGCSSVRGGCKVFACRAGTRRGCSPTQATAAFRSLICSGAIRNLRSIEQACGCSSERGGCSRRDQTGPSERCLPKYVEQVFFSLFKKRRGRVWPEKQRSKEHPIPSSTAEYFNVQHKWSPLAAQLFVVSMMPVSYSSHRCKTSSLPTFPPSPSTQLRPMSSFTASTSSQHLHNQHGPIIISPDFNTFTRRISCFDFFEKNLMSLAAATINIIDGGPSPTHS